MTTTTTTTTRSSSGLADIVRTTTMQTNMPIVITPADAEWALMHTNTHNRVLTGRWVDELARRIKAGLWHLTHAGIAFDTGGVLIDGQHRLWAVVLSETAVTMRVFLNEPSENIQVIDTGRPRASHEVITLAGGLGIVSKNQIATLRVLVSGLQSYARQSPAEEADLLRRHLQAVEFATTALPASRYRGVATAAVRGVLGRAFYSADLARLRHFADVLRTGVISSEDDSPAALLIQAALVAQDGRRSLPQNRVMYGKAQRALSAFLRGEQLSVLRAVTEDLFPLPAQE
jgi:hypothetical protein